ncbi:DUF3971 domain-containing protein [Arcobacter defluvii]|nr:DUF3971 domain-containing protein [Arcobacter defluvii]
MDKKLILDIGNLEYKSKKTQTKSSFDDLKKDIELLPKVLMLFQKINIKKLKIDDNEFKIVLDENNLYLDNKYINISSKLDVASNQILFELSSLYLKDIDILFDGKIKIDYFTEELNYFGKFYYQDLEANLNIDMTKELAKFYIVSSPFKSLKFLKNFLDLPKTAEEWMYDNVEGNITLEGLYAEFDLKNNKLIEKSLNGKAHIENAKIKFHQDVDAIQTKNLDITFKDDNLYFNLIEPTFKDKSLEGSYVTIHNLASVQNGEVEVNIKTNSKLDKDILDILKAYKINLPLVQKSGTTDATLTLIFPYELEKPMTTKGEFLVNDAEISIGNFSFNSKTATVILDGSNVLVKDADFKYKDMIDALVNINIDTKTLKSSGDTIINSLIIKKENGEKIIDIKDKKTALDMDFNKDTIIDLKDLETTIKIADLIYVNINNISKIYPYSKLLKDISIKDGNISLDIKDDKNIKFKALIKGLNLPLKKDGQSIENLDIVGNISGKNIDIHSIDENIKVEIKDDLKIYLNNLFITIDTKKQDTNNINQKMNLYLTNDEIDLNGTIYKIKNANLSIKKEEINFEANLKELDLPLKKNGKKINELTLLGIYKNNYTKLNTKNNDLILELKNENLSLNINGYDILYSSEDKEENDSYKNINIIGNSSNIIVNDKYKFLSDTFEIRVRENEKFIHLKHKKSDITFKESKDKKIDIFTSDISDEFVNTIFDKNIFKGGNILFLANGDINNLNGKIIIENSNIEDLAILNNLLIFIHTSPALVNPLLAVPSVVGMATNQGFNLTAYKIVNGVMEFNYSKEKELIDVKKLVTIGNGIDFEGKGKVNLNDLTLDSEIKLIFLKDYSKIVGAIPVVNYVLLGDSNRVETQVNVFGELSNPKISTNLTKETFSIPVNIAKRILSSPSMLLDFIKGTNESEKKEEKSSEELINKPLK